jgi:hypothetical protein
MAVKSKKSDRSSQVPTHYLRARPWLGRQLEDNPNLLLFWRDGPAQSRQGMAWILQACPNANCPCRDVFVHAIAVSDAMVWVQVQGEAIQTGMAPDPKELAGPYVKRSALVKVDVATGAISAEKDRHNDEKLFGWLKAELDGAVLTVLRTWWNTVRGRPADAVIPSEQRCVCKPLSVR